ncbi:hypothetical protein RB195_025313 [Necator americanus]|uniref:Uncharacterized protein n=1 Tax=Necator americanus TaxID=51031 RepID=A0ABR1ERU0_NECAM
MNKVILMRATDRFAAKISVTDSNSALFRSIISAVVNVCKAFVRLENLDKSIVVDVDEIITSVLLWCTTLHPFSV